MTFPFKSGLMVLVFVSLGWVLLCSGQTAQQPAVQPSSVQPSSIQQSASEHAGSVSGTVVDQSGAVVAGARVKLAREDGSHEQEALSGDNGQFSFSNLAPGPFHLTISSEGFATQTVSGILHAAETSFVPQIMLTVAAEVTEVKVGYTREEVAEEQIKVQEKQRVFGAIPNFYVSYIPNAVPLTSKQKFKLAWKTVIDPFTFTVVAGAAGVEQAQNHFEGYGQGAEGYAKRFGAGYADTVVGTFLGGAIFPSLLKQDPRYFYKGTGSVGSRFLYAVGNSVICKGDNGRWQPNYSNVLGSLAAGGISNIYYPSDDRNGADLTFENAGIGLGATAAANVLQEFLIKKLTPKPKHHPAKP